MCPTILGTESACYNTTQPVQAPTSCHTTTQDATDVTCTQISILGLYKLQHHNLDMYLQPSTLTYI
jgi:hypothetical protein